MKVQAGFLTSAAALLSTLIANRLRAVFDIICAASLMVSSSKERKAMSKTVKKFDAGKLVRTALLIAIIFVMAFTPLGYFKTGGLSITLLPIPVVIGAIVMGPATGAVLGLAFGVTSVLQCFGLDPFGTTLIGINPFGLVLTCLIPRILMGFLTGLIAKGFIRMDKGKTISFAAASLIGALLNTTFFMSLLILFFYNTDFIQSIATSLGTSSPFAFVVAMVGINGVIEAIACCVLGGAISEALYAIGIKRA